jgi:hypothetical protein
MRQAAVYYRLPGVLLFDPAKGGTWGGEKFICEESRKPRNNYPHELLGLCLRKVRNLPNPP